MSSSIYDKVKLFNPNTHIRLLRLQHDKVKDSANAQITCSLSAWSLSDHPPYRAISYHWGTSSTSTDIVINEENFPVSENCRYSLWQAWTHRPKTYLWIDAICINQTDLEEKSAQVAIMYEIYTAATSVCACIGPHDDASRSLIAFTERFGSASSAMRECASFKEGQVWFRQGFGDDADLKPWDVSESWEAKKGSQYHELLEDLDDGSSGNGFQDLVTESQYASILDDLERPVYRIHPSNEKRYADALSKDMMRHECGDDPSAEERRYPRVLTDAAADNQDGWRSLAKSYRSEKREDKDAVKPMLRLFDQRPYWRRLWIVQELCAGSSDGVEILCGESKMRWAVIQALAAAFDDEYWGLGFDKTVEQPMNPLRHSGPSRIGGLGMVLRARSGERSFWDILPHLSEWQCRDGRDKIFGIMKLIKWPKGQSPTVDYKKTGAEVAEEVVRILAPKSSKEDEKLIRKLLDP